LRLWAQDKRNKNEALLLLDRQQLTRTVKETDE